MTDLEKEIRIDEMAEIIAETTGMHTFRKTVCSGLVVEEVTAHSVADKLSKEGYRKASDVEKETAKKILQGLKFVYSQRAKEYTNWDTNKIQAVSLEWLNADIAELAEDYGVEVDI